MRLCLLLFLNVRVRLSLFGNLSEDEAVPVAVPECEGVRLSFFGNLTEDEAVPVDVPDCEGEARLYQLMFLNVRVRLGCTCCCF
jgi:hypothetical protein